MFAAFSVRALDPPFATVSMDEQDSSPDPEAPGHHLKELLAKQVSARSSVRAPAGILNRIWSPLHHSLE